MPHLLSKQTVIETPDYLADAEDARLTAAEREAIVDFVAENPKAGDLIAGSGGARKLRFRGRGKGKSGGYRVIAYFGGDDIPVFLLNIFAKSDRVNLSKAEVNALREELSGLAEDYRRQERRLPRHRLFRRRRYSGLPAQHLRQERSGEFEQGRGQRVA